MTVAPPVLLQLKASALATNGKLSPLSCLRHRGDHWSPVQLLRPSWVWGGLLRQDSRPLQSPVG